MTKLHKDGDHFGIETDCLSEIEFLKEVSVRIALLIENREYEHDWTFQLDGWLPLVVTICDSLKGNKSTAMKKQITYCGLC